jgi:hypothetical protein
MLETFFPPENVRNFYNRPEPGVFYGGRLNNLIRKIEKEKSTMVMPSFFINLIFFSLVEGQTIQLGK